MEQDTIKTWVAHKRRAPTYWQSYRTTFGWTEEPEQSSSTSPLTTRTSTCSASSRKEHYCPLHLYPPADTHPLVDQSVICFFRLVVEFPATGGAIPSYQIRTVKLIRYITTWDYFILGCELLFCVFILYYIVEEILELKIHKFSYFNSIWNILDIVVILVRKDGSNMSFYQIFQGLLKTNNLLTACHCCHHIQCISDHQSGQLAWESAEKS